VTKILLFILAISAIITPWQVAFAYWNHPRIPRRPLRDLAACFALDFLLLSSLAALVALIGWMIT